MHAGAGFCIARAGNSGERLGCNRAKASTPVAERGPNHYYPALATRAALHSVSENQ